MSAFLQDFLRRKKLAGVDMRHARAGHAKQS
jgi:hypothetical protein